MSIVPEFLVMHASIVASSLSTTLSLTLDAMEQAYYLPIIRWSIPAGSVWRIDSLAAWLAKSAPTSEVRDAQIDLAEGCSLNLYRDQTRADMWNLRVDFAVTASSEASAKSLVAGAAMLSRRLLATAAVERLEVYRQGGGARCLPVAPVAGGRTHVVAATAEEIARAYEAPDLFLNAGWDSIEPFGACALFVRAQDAVNNLQFLSEVQPHQWAMARAARPGLTQYFLPMPTSEEMEIYRQGGPFLQPAGHIAPENLIELCCYMPPGEHLPGWEIFNVFGMLQSKALPDGRKVEAVRVVFFDRASAEEEKRPLLDVGASVFYQDGTGELVQLVDEPDSSGVSSVFSYGDSERS